jgi:hypothetical protein
MITDIDGPQHTSNPPITVLNPRTTKISLMKI